MRIKTIINHGKGLQKKYIYNAAKNKALQDCIGIGDHEVGNSTS